MSARDVVPQTTDIPNPLTPLALLPEDVADKLTVLIYVLITCLGIMVWDVLNHLVEDFNLVFRLKFNWRVLFFVAARISPVLCFLTMAIFFTAKLDDCTPLHYTWVTLLVITNFTTCLLFYFRVCAIYNNNLYVVGFFMLTLLAVVGGASLTYWGTNDMHIGPTEYCISLITSKYIAFGTVTELINDASVFLAIMYKLNRMRVEDGGSSWLAPSSLFNRRKRTSRLTDILVEESQIYYLIALVMNLAKIISFFVLSNPPDSPIRIVLMFPNIVIENIIAIRVYRNLRLGRPGLNIFGSSETKRGTSEYANYRIQAFHKPEFTTGSDAPSRTVGNANEGGIISLPSATDATEWMSMVPTDPAKLDEKDSEIYLMKRGMDVESRGN